MRFTRTAIIALVCLAAAIQQAIAVDTPPAVASTSTRASSKAVIVGLDGEIDDFNERTLFQRFDEARRLGADTIILQLNTYGGLVTAGLDISRFLKRQNDLHIICFVDDKAIYAGAMIALACDEIVMQPGSMLGDCAPISLSPTGTGMETMGAAERAKAESPILADFDDSARRNGYDPLLVQSMVSVGRIVHWIQNDAGERRFVDQATYDKLIHEGWKAVPDVADPVDGPETLLTVSADTALKLGLAKAIEASPESLAASRGLTILDTFTSSAGEAIISLLSSAAVRGILTTIFLFTLYTSFSHPGHGMPEVICVTTLGLLVGVPLLTGYAQWWEILAIIIGVFLIALEIFVVPGLGFVGISGMMLLLLGLTMTWVGKEPWPGIMPHLQGTWSALRQAIVIVVAGMFCSMLLWFWLQRYLPKLPYFNRLILTTISGSIAGMQSATDSTKTVWPPPGSRGRAITDLRPGGSAAFHDSAINNTRIIDVISDSGFVAAGADVAVREVRGNHVVVRALT
jgi:membrane-bound serine protease (ClpP class)